MNMMVYNREWDTEVTVSFDIPNVNYTLGYILVMQMTHNLFDSRAQSRLTSINQSSRRLLSVQCLCTAPLTSYYGRYRANTVQIQYWYNRYEIQMSVEWYWHVFWGIIIIQSRPKTSGQWPLWVCKLPLLLKIQMPANGCLYFWDQFNWTSCDIFVFLVILIGFSNRQKSFYSVNSNQDVSRRGEHLIRAMHRFCG